MTDLRGLSPLARGLLEGLGVTRDPEWTTSGEALRAELAALSWPCSEEVLRAEEIAGGLTGWPACAFGVHATLRLLRGDVPWDRDDMQDYDLRADPRDAGRRLLPLWIHDDPWVWLGLDGRVFWGSHIDYRDYFAPAFADVAHYWEVWALLDGHIVSAYPPGALPRPRLDVSALVGEAIARELDLASFAPGTRGMTRAFAAPGGRVVELDAPGFLRGTVAVSDTAEGVVLAAAAALRPGVAARITSAEALDPGLLDALPVPTETAASGPATYVYTWGKFTSYEDERYRQRHRDAQPGERAREKRSSSR